MEKHSLTADFYIIFSLKFFIIDMNIKTFIHQNFLDFRKNCPLLDPYYLKIIVFFSKCENYHTTQQNSDKRYCKQEEH